MDQRTLSILEAYFDISGEQLQLLCSSLEFQMLTGGEWLFRQGDAGDALYLLVRGRLQVWLEAGAGGPLDQPVLIGRITPGDSVGEIGLLIGAPRAAGVRAIRDSQLIRLDRNAFEHLSQQHPSLVMRLAARAASLVQKPSALASGATRNLSAVALLPLDATERTLEFCRGLAEQLKAHGTIRLLDLHGLETAGAPVHRLPEHEPVPDALVQWVQKLEDDTRLLVFQCEARDCAWTRFCLRQSDLVILVGEHGRDAAVRPWEARLGIGDRGTSLRRMLVLLQGPSSQAIVHTADWYLGRVLDFHLHVRANRSEDIARLARVVAGEAIGLVLGSGASRGFAHLGVYRALREAGVPIDWIGGTSIGAIMGALMAMDLPPERCIEVARSCFVGGKPFSDYTLPLVSLLAGRRMKRLIRSQASMNIEDLPLPFFCISSDLDEGKLNLHQAGSLSRALEATASMPGILPPTVIDRRLAVDGSVLNSLPVDVMWQQAVGRVIASDLCAQRSRSVDYADIPSAWTLLRSKLLPLGKRYRVPSLMTVLLKATELATLQNVRTQGERASLLLQPDVRRFGLTEVRAFDRIVEAGYLSGLEKIGQWLAENRG